ncbi:MAG: glycosyltransferase family 29 protein [Bdellovibrionales bacterium]|nr:glycosyltransferase family 29 protein [Bdellovibrionales bacterium]
MENLQHIFAQEFSPIPPSSANSCAVVGNSGVLLQQEYGPEIDSHDFVIRFNQARTRGYERRTGAKTSLRILNLHSVLAFNGEMKNLNEAQDIFSNFSSDIFRELQETHYLLKDEVDLSRVRAAYPTAHFHTVAPKLRESLVALHPCLTCGFLGVVYALKFFSKVTCFGFDFYEGKDDHYYEQVKKYDRSCHDMSFEKNFMLTLAQEGRIALKRSLPSVLSTSVESPQSSEHVAEPIPSQQVLDYLLGFTKQ